AGKLHFVSTVGSGFDDRGLREMKAHLDELATSERQVDVVPPGYGAIHWVRPETVVEVKFNQQTSDGRLRAPVFLRLREDKAPAEAVAAAVVPGPAAEDQPKPSR